MELLPKSTPPTAPGRSYGKAAAWFPFCAVLICTFGLFTISSSRCNFITDYSSKSASQLLQRSRDQVKTSPPVPQPVVPNGYSATFSHLLSAGDADTTHARNFNALLNTAFDTQYSNIAIIVPWFQPVKAQRPLSNMLVLLHKLDRLHMHYYISELAADGEPFEFDSHPNVFRFRSNAPYLWHKENLVLQTVRRLPPQITKIVWLDKDVWFDDDQWLARVNTLLDTVDIVQPFERICMQSPEYSHCLPSLYNFSKAASFLRGCNVRRKPCGHPGLALGVRRDIIEQLGLMERSIIGSGDQLFWNAVVGNTATTSPKYMTELIPRVGITYTEFRLGLPLMLGHAPRVAFLHNVTATHLYHGSPKNKQHVARIRMLVRENFTSADFYENEDNMWALYEPERWKPVFYSYFKNRDEDGIDENDLRPQPPESFSGVLPQVKPRPKRAFRWATLL